MQAAQFAVAGGALAHANVFGLLIALGMEIAHTEHKRYRAYYQKQQE
jgi:hypothetical protein